MSERRKLGRLVMEESGVNDAHAHVRVFDQGALCGTLVLSRGTWDGLKVVEDPPVGVAGDPPSISEAVRSSFDDEATGP